MDSKNFDFEISGVAGVLKNHDLSVPLYQRSYAWSEQQVKDFWDDIFEAFSVTPTEYFLGTIVLTKGSDDGRLSIIDGQQRLATTSILLAAIQNAFSDRDDERADIIRSDYLAKKGLRSASLISKLSLSGEDDHYYQTVIVNRREASATKDSHKLIYNALDFFSDKINLFITDAGSSWAVVLSDLALFLEKSVLLVTLTTSNDADAFVIFETLNDRGAELTIADLLKNYLFGKAERRLASVQQNWMSATSTLEASSVDKVFVKFLRQYWSSRVGPVRERDLYKSIKEKINNSEDASELAANLQTSAELYSAILNENHAYWDTFGNSARNCIDTLLKLGVDQYRPLLLAALEIFGKEEKIPLLKALVSWTVRGLIVGGLGGGAAEAAYCKAAVRVRSREISNTEEVLQELGNVVASDNVFISAFEIAAVKKAAQARYYLIALEKGVRGEAEQEFVPNNNADEVNLEHVLPKNATTYDWPSFNEDEIAEYCTRLGNMALLKKSENNAIGNGSFSVKKPALAASSIVLTKEIGETPDWTKETIEERQRKLANIAVNVWKRA